MKKFKKMQLPDDVSIFDAYRYIQAVEEAVRKGIGRFGRKDRTFIVESVREAMRLSSESLAELLAEMQREGAAYALTDDEKMRLAIMFSNEAGPKKPS